MKSAKNRLELTIQGGLKGRIIMQTKFIVLGIVLVAGLLLLTYCNLPNRESTEVVVTPTTTPQMTITPTADLTTTSPSTPTRAITLCDHPYQPSNVGDTWVYAGSSSTRAVSTRTDRVIKSSETAFTIKSELPGVDYTVDYTCTAQGLVADNPVQQYLGALLASPSQQLEVKLISASGISLPAEIKPGDTWQQVAEVDAKIRGTSANGWLVYDYKAVGFETVTVPFGTFEALRVVADIRIEVTPFRILAGTFTVTSWLVEDIGMVKSEGTSDVPGVDFSGTLELTEFTGSP